jgi:hypothetical protein
MERVYYRPSCITPSNKFSSCDNKKAKRKKILVAASRRSKFGIYLCTSARGLASSSVLGIARQLKGSCSL